MPMGIKKYCLIYSAKIVTGVTLYRIKALKDFGEVKKGEQGGFVQSEANLSQVGDCWVDGNACVFGDAKVSEDAWVFDDAKVYGTARISGSAQVCENAKVYGDAEVSGEELVCGTTHLSKAITEIAPIPKCLCGYPGAPLDGNDVYQGYDGPPMCPECKRC